MRIHQDALLSFLTLSSALLLGDKTTVVGFSPAVWNNGVSSNQQQQQKLQSFYNTILPKKKVFGKRSSNKIQLNAAEEPASAGEGGDLQEPASSSPTSTTPATPAPVLNGKRVLPYKVIMAGLKGHEVAGVYAIMNKEYKRGQEGWEQCEHIGVSIYGDLYSLLSEFLEKYGPEKVAHIRALTFVIPNENAMEQVANDWRIQAFNAGGKINFDPVMAAIEMSMGFEDDDDDEDDDDYDDDDDDDEFLEMTAEALSLVERGRQGGIPQIQQEQEEPEAEVVSKEEEEEPLSSTVTSPFDESVTTATATAGNAGTNIVMPPPAASTAQGEKLEFNAANVDKVLDEVRPYLISDGGNVSVARIDVDTRSVYLKLEGACGSCPSSTVTMQMGIERVLKENFENIGEVAQVEDENDNKPKELTYELVETEINRIKPAIIAMGGMVEIVSVDPIGVVEIKFRGANKVRQGLELALLDIDFVKHVNFVSQD